MDAAYTLPLLVTLASLRAELPPERALHAYLVHTGLPPSHLDAIGGLVDTTPILLSPGLRASIPAHRHFPPEAAVPLLLGELLPESLERVVFLDADLLVLHDPTELFDVDLAGRALGAAVDEAIGRCSAPRGVRGWRALEIPSSAPYFNAGVLTISLPEWRASDVGRRALRHLERHGRGGGFLHQEALNATSCDDWLPLDPRWNVLASHARRPGGSNVATAGIVHFSGRLKPWRGRIAGPFDEPYRSVLARVAPLVASTEPALRDRVLSAYDRRLRDVMFPVERALWKRGVI